MRGAAGTGCGDGVRDGVRHTHVVDGQLGGGDEAADLGRLGIAEDEALDEDGELRHDHARAGLALADEAREEEREDLVQAHAEAAAKAAARPHRDYESSRGLLRVRVGVRVWGGKVALAWLGLGLGLV